MQRTTSTFVRSTPAAARSSRKLVCRLSQVGSYAALAVISDASVDNNQRITRPNDKRLYSEEDLTFVIREVRLKPRDSVDRRRRCFGEKDQTKANELAS